MNTTSFRVQLPRNEAVLSYAPGTPERSQLEVELERQAKRTLEIPLIIGGKEIRTGRIAEVRAPHDRHLLLGTYHLAGPDEVQLAIRSAREAARDWAGLSWMQRAAVFMKAADLLAGPHRISVNAATMLGQSKTAHQAEIDSACEMIDFLRFNVFYWDGIFAQQPPHSRIGESWNMIDYRPLEGFLLAVTPFNFTAIGGNLPSSPAMAGNVVIWKPASTAVLSNFHLMRVFLEAGLPPGVINFLPGPGSALGPILLDHPDFAGLHFTGSTPTFREMWRRVGDNVGAGRYRNYPRLVGETGGKDFVLACPDADPETLAVALVRGAFEYQGQKCSAASRAYIPESLWNEVESSLKETISQIKVGDVREFSNFMGGVIDEASYRNVRSYIKMARETAGTSIICGGGHDDRTGWFIQPTVIRCDDPAHPCMTEEIFGPVLSIHVYKDSELDRTLELVDSSSPYALTGAVFGRDRGVLELVSSRLRYSAGNFYINDKPTGAVVGQQPFGGGRASGTNDKAGSPLNLLRWVSPRTIKETFVPARSVSYPFMESE